jgi:hypothetical protein
VLWKHSEPIRRRFDLQVRAGPRPLTFGVRSRTAAAADGGGGPASPRLTGLKPAGHKVPPLAEPEP